MAIEGTAGNGALIGHRTGGVEGTAGNLSTAAADVLHIGIESTAGDRAGVFHFCIEGTAGHGAHTGRHRIIEGTAGDGGHAVHCTIVGTACKHTIAIGLHFTAKDTILNNTIGDQINIRRTAGDIAVTVDEYHAAHHLVGDRIQIQLRSRSDFHAFFAVAKPVVHLPSVATDGAVVGQRRGRSEGNAVCHIHIGNQAGGSVGHRASEGAARDGAVVDDLGDQRHDLCRNAVQIDGLALFNGQHAAGQCPALAQDGAVVHQRIHIVQNIRRNILQVHFCAGFDGQFNFFRTAVIRTDPVVCLNSSISLHTVEKGDLVLIGFIIKRLAFRVRRDNQIFCIVKEQLRNAVKAVEFLDRQEFGAQRPVTAGAADHSTTALFQFVCRIDNVSGQNILLHRYIARYGQLLACQCPSVGSDGASVLNLQVFVEVRLQFVDHYGNIFFHHQVRKAAGIGRQLNIAARHVQRSGGFGYQHIAVRALEPAALDGGAIVDHRAAEGAARDGGIILDGHFAAEGTAGNAGVAILALHRALKGTALNLAGVTNKGGEGTALNGAVACIIYAREIAVGNGIVVKNIPIIDTIFDGAIVFHNSRKACGRRILDGAVVVHLGNHRHDLCRNAVQIDGLALCNGQRSVGQCPALAQDGAGIFDRSRIIKHAQQLFFIQTAVKAAQQGQH